MEGLRVHQAVKATRGRLERENAYAGWITTHLRYGVELMLHGHLDATFCL